MQFRFNFMGLSLALMSLFSLGAIGCGQQTNGTAAPDAATPVSDASVPAGDHSGWWCAEHGVPEKECSICSSKVAAQFKAKGDWCEEHGRAESQCFLCDPTRAEKFAALYEAKFGEKPPRPTE